MFRRKENTLDSDPTYPASLEKLGYFIDSSKAACIRNLKRPELFFDFRYTNNERHNEVHSEAMRECQREGVRERLAALGLGPLYLPTLTNVKPDVPHIPILAPAAEVLKTRKRIVVVINDDHYQDLGILAYRLLQREGGLNGGSIINFAKKLISRNNPDADLEEKLSTDRAGVQDNEQIPGLIVMNTASLLYSHKFNKALVMRSWNSLPRQSIFHDPIMVHEENRVDGHRTQQEHVKSVFDSVIKNPEFVAPDAEVYVVAIENGSSNIVDILNEDFWKFSDRITAMAIINTGVDVSQIHEPALKAFLHMRTRQWKPSDNRTDDPSRLIDMPLDYKVPSTGQPQNVLGRINWLEKATGASVNHLKNARHRFNSSEYSKAPQPDTVADAPVYDEWSSNTEALCPTFSGGDTWVGECVFTQPLVQDTILGFFEEVSQDTKNFCNPVFILDDVPQPTPEDPLSLEPASSAPAAIPEEMLLPEQQAINGAQAVLAEMQIALSVTPSTTAAFQESRKLLSERIAKQEAKVEDMEMKALSTGGLGAGAAEELRKKWDNKAKGDTWPAPRSGPAIKFAGVEVDSEAVKEAGCLNTVEEELRMLGL